MRFSRLVSLSLSESEYFIRNRWELSECSYSEVKFSRSEDYSRALVPYNIIMNI